MEAAHLCGYHCIMVRLGIYILFGILVREPDAIFKLGAM
jgi:hypothetical protein